MDNTQLLIFFSMKIFGIIILIVVFYWIVLPLARLYLRIRKARNQFRDIYNNFPGSNAARDRTHGNRAANTHTTPKAKKFRPDEGEYVDFEEIDATYCEYDPEAGEVRYEREQQVTDVEWEDIPTKP